MNVTAAIILGESDWEIRVPIGTFATRQLGQEALNSSTSILAVVENHAGIRLTINGTTWFLTDSNVQIRELNEAAKARLGPPQ